MFASANSLIDMPLGTGEKFAGYTVLRLLGSGGMGEVYLVSHPRLPRQDAVKVLPAEMSSDKGYRARFTREADVAAGLWHPHIVGVHDRGESEGRLWIAMDYVDGTDAARMQRERYPSGMPPAEVVPILNAVASALDYAHSSHLLHRDVKPSNILLTQPERGPRRIMLADFGVARLATDDSGLTTTNTAVGSVAYIAPEQLTSAPLDARADQYALAATAYHLLTGAPPFAHTNPAVVIAKRLSSPPPVMSETHPRLRGLDAVMARGMARDPRGRFNSCSEFAEAFATRAAHPDVPEREPPTVPVAARMPGPPPVLRNVAPPPVMVPGWATPRVPGDDRPPPLTAAAPQAKSSRSRLPWLFSAAALAVIVVAVVLAVNITDGDAPSVVTSEALTPVTSESESDTTTTTTVRTPTATAKPPVIVGADPRNENCADGIQLPGTSGWASRAGRGSAETSCFFARSVLEAYWAEYPSPSTESRTVQAAGSVPCTTTEGECAGDKFVMHCAVRGRDGWITCTGGKNARVYLY